MLIIPAIDIIEGKCVRLTQGDYSQKKIYNENLNKGGEIFFTNIAKGNPYRVWMEYCFNWELIERTKADVGQLFADASLKNSELEIRKEETGLTYLVNIKNTDHIFFG